METFFDLKMYMNDDYPNCNIYHCTRCLNSTYCEHCNELLDYFLDEVGTCQLCNITGCIECEDVTTCKTCDEDGNYFFNGQQECELCNISGCLDCINL